MITESTALASVRKAGIRPAWNQIAAGTHHKRWQLRTERARFGSIIKLAFRSNAATSGHVSHFDPTDGWAAKRCSARQS
jgi:hypothetical protein